MLLDNVKAAGVVDHDWAGGERDEAFLVAHTRQSARIARTSYRQSYPTSTGAVLVRHSDREEATHAP